MPGPVIDIQADGPDRPVSHRGARFGCGSVILGIFLLLIGSKSIASAIIDYQWWNEVGQLETLWKQLYVHTAPIFYATAFGYIVLWIVHARALKSAGVSLSRFPWYARISSLAMLPIAWILGALEFSSWDIATWLGSRGITSSSDWRDPVFNNPIEFYFFELPVYKSITADLFFLLAVCAIGYWIASRLWALRSRFTGGQVIIDWTDMTSGNLSGARMLGAAALLALAAREWFARYSPLYDEHPFLTGADYVAVNLAIPLATAWALLVVVGAGLLAAGRGRQALFILLFLPIRAIVPGIVNSVHVRPNEITLQKPYIEHHMRATRAAFGLGAKFKSLPVKASPTARIDVAANQASLDNVRLWDWRAFHDTVTQIQALRPYYVFNDSDVDRYQIDGQLRQLLLTPREIDVAQLPGDARARWINPPLHLHPRLRRSRRRSYPHHRRRPPPSPHSGCPAGRQDHVPQIHAARDSTSARCRTSLFSCTRKQPEFDYPSGSGNVETRYAGQGGFPISSPMLRFAAALSTGDWNILLTSYLAPESRMMIRRKVGDRLKALAEFIAWDSDPYLVITSAGRLVWIVDGYTSSDAHPYSRHLSIGAGPHQLPRNSVKATVDAYDGTAISTSSIRPTPFSPLTASSSRSSSPPQFRCRPTSAPTPAIPN